MKLRKPKPETQPSSSRLFDDGYADAKAGRVLLDQQVFESAVDYHLYKSGYDRFVAEQSQQQIQKMGEYTDPFSHIQFYPSGCTPGSFPRGSGMTW